jgi:hypothetical protein
MDNILASIIDNNVPKFNKNIVDGTANKVLKDSPKYLDKKIKNSLKSLNKNIDLTYMGYRRLTPKEEYEKLIVKKNSKSMIKTVYDLAQNDLYSVEFIFNYMGRELRKPLQLLFSRRGNITYISNTSYSIVPVLTDTVISPTPTNVFVRLDIDKIRVENTIRNFIVNEERVTGHIIYSRLVKVNTKQLIDKIGKPLTTLSLYLLGKYGMKKTMMKYLKTDKYIITNGNVNDLREDYNVYESTKIKPNGSKIFLYEGHDIKICIHKSVKRNILLDNFIYGVIYSLDVLPEHANECIEVVNENNIENEILYWRILLGRIAYYNNYTVDIMGNDIEDHFEVLNGYLDDDSRDRLLEIEIECDDFFDFLAVMLEKYNYWLLTSKEHNGDIKNRYVDYRYYLMYPITSGFNKIILNINKRYLKKQISYEEFNKIYGDELTHRKIYTLVKNKVLNLALIVSDYVGDIMYIKCTSFLEDQSRGNGVKKDHKAKMPEANKVIKGDDMVLGSVLNFNKSSPSPNHRCNPFLNFNVNNGKIYKSESTQRTVIKINKGLNGKMINDKIEVFNND